MGPLCCHIAGLSPGQGGSVGLAGCALWSTVMGLGMRDQLQPAVFHLLGFTPRFHIPGGVSEGFQLREELVLGNNHGCLSLQPGCGPMRRPSVSAPGAGSPWCI